MAILSKGVDVLFVTSEVEGGGVMFIRKPLISALALLTAILGGRTVAAADENTWDGTIVQYGKMHEAIGQQRHEGRVQLKTLVERPHFFGVAAVEKLGGEATIHDGRVTVTRVDAKGQPKSGDTLALETQLTLAIGAYVPSWTESKVTEHVKADDFDQFIAGLAAKAGIKMSTPFVFTAEGEFSELRLHIINGACPLHARLRKIEIPKERQPYEIELKKVRGTLVGVFAADAVGDVTHPGTSTHTHLLFTDASSGETVTGHVEQIGLLEGSVVRIPKTK
jgi:alpha-acetolactate decarboxylase